MLISSDLRINKKSDIYKLTYTSGIWDMEWLFSDLKEASKLFRTYKILKPKLYRNETLIMEMRG